jgi:hypothetical protein
MLQQLQAHLKTLQDTGAPDEQIKQVKDLIKAEKERQKQVGSIADAEMEQLRTEQLSGINRHLKELENIQQGFNLAEKAILEKRNAQKTAAGREYYNQQLIELEREKKVYDLRVQSAKDVNEWFKNKGFVTDFTASKTGRFLSDMEGAFTAIGATMASALKPANLFAAGMDQMIAATKQLFTDFDSAQASLSRVTATTGEYNDMLYDLQESNKTFGVDSKIAGEAIGNLHNELSTFNQMSSATQGMLSETTARMEVLGVSTSVGAKQFDNMIQGMGMTATMANDASMELVALGDAIGMAASQISDGFNAAASELAKYGADAIDVFKGLASAAKATGIEMSSLMSITKQYDTFEGAAQGAGKLNAILGGGVVNSMDLLNATEEERIRLMIQSMQLSGKNFESLNRFEKQAIASAAGISDMTEANKLFSMSLSAYDEMQTKGSEANAEAALMEERAQAVQTLSEKLKMIGQSFAIAFMPVLEFMHGFANMILMINDMTGGIFIPAMVGVVGVIALLGKTTAITNAIMSIGMSITMARAAIETGYGNVLAFISLVKEGSNIREKVGIALDLMSIPVKEAKSAANTKEGLSANFASLANSGLAASLAAVTAAIVPLVPAVVAIGFAIGGLGLAIAAPFIALTALVIAFKDVFIAMLEAPKAIGAAIAGLIGFAIAAALSMNIIAIAMIPFSIAMFAAGVFLSAAAIALIPFTLVIAFLAPSLLIFSLALQQFAKGISMFNKVGQKELTMAVASLTAFGLDMIGAALFFTVGATLVGIPMLVFGMALMQFAKGISMFNKVGGKELAMAVASLTAFGMDLIIAALFFGVGATLVGIPMLLFGMGLQQFGKGIAAFNKVGQKELFMAVESLTAFGLDLIITALFFTVGALLMAIPMMLLAEGLLRFAQGIRAFNKVGGGALSMALLSITAFGIGLLLVSPFFAFVAAIMAIPMMMIGDGLIKLAKGISTFAKIGVEGIKSAVDGLNLFAWSLVFMSPILLIASAAMMLFYIPFMLFGVALTMVGLGLLFIGESIPALFALTDALSLISMIGLTGTVAMAMLATSIMGIALALAFIPESKTMSFGFAMEGYGAALAAVAALSPETVELSERVVAAAGEYAEVQAEMKMPDEDSFVQAMKNVFGMGDKKGGSGQDIILQLNGRELGRAVDVQLNKMHNLSID